MIDELLERMGDEYLGLQFLASYGRPLSVTGTFYEFAALVMEGCDRYGNLVERHEALHGTLPLPWRLCSAWQRLEMCSEMNRPVTVVVLSALAQKGILA